MAKTRTRKQARARWLVGGFVVLFVLLFTHDYIFNRHRLTLTVEVLDAPVDCWSDVPLGRTRFLDPKRRRDFAPTRAAIVHWCGGAITDAGFYRLPETHVLNILDTRRAELLETLREGCRYDVTVVGKGGKQNPNRPRAPVIQRISRVHRELGCAPSS